MRGSEDVFAGAKADVTLSSMPHRETPASLAGVNEGFCGRENLPDQLRRGRFRVDAQERLGARGAEQHPRFGAIAFGRAVQEELDSIQAFFFEHRPLAQSSSSVGARPLDGARLHVVGNMKVKATV